MADSHALTQEHKRKLLEHIQKEVKEKFDKVNTVDDLKKMTPAILLYIRF